MQRSQHGIYPSQKATCFTYNEHLKAVQGNVVTSQLWIYQDSPSLTVHLVGVH